MLLYWTRGLRGTICLAEASPSGAGSATLAVLAVRRVEHCTAPSGWRVLLHCFCIGRGAYVGRFGITEASPSGAGSATTVGFSASRVKHCTAPSGWRVLLHCFCVGRGVYVGRFGITEASPSGAGSATLVVLAVRRVKHCAAPSGDWSGGRDGRSHSLHLLLRACRAGAPPWSARASTPPLPGQHAPNWGMLRRFRPHRRDFAPPALQLASRTPLLAAPGSGLALTLTWGGLASRRSLPRQHAPNWGMLRRFRPHRRPNAPPRPPADPRTLLLALRPSRSWQWLPWSDARPLLHC